MKKVFFLVMILGVLIFSTAVTFAENVGRDKKIIYIPIDNRPINLTQTIEVATRLGYEVLLPPENILGTGATPDKFGNPDELWAWLKETAPLADAAVISTDAMLYGSLVASRQHELTHDEVLERAKNFENLREENPLLPIYAFATVMRTPRAGGSSAEPEYYKTYAAQFFNYTALKDKAETQKLSKKDLKEMEQLESAIPQEYLEDWLKRRAKNYDALTYFADLTSDDVLQYFLVGGDDSAEFSQTNLELRHLSNYAKNLGVEKFQAMAGADELGILMLSRAINHDLQYVPLIAISYNEGKGGETIPTYSNEKISESLAGAINAVGGIKISNLEKADLVLAINTNPNGKTFEAASKKNKPKPHTGIGPYMTIVKGYIKSGYPVGVVDIAAANGSDNALMKRLRNEDLQFKIRSYSGWNTATNSSGFLIGAGVLTNYMNEKDIYSLLLMRYLDEWAYQANIRTQINNGLIWTVPGEGNIWGLGTRQEGLENLATDLMSKFVAKNIRLPRGYTLENLRVRFKWSRTFEADISFDLVN